MKTLALYGLTLTFFFLSGMSRSLSTSNMRYHIAFVSIYFFNHKTLGCGNNHIGYTIKPWTPRIKLSLLYSLMFHMKHIFRFYVLDTWSSLLISSNSPLWILPLMNRWHWGQVLDFMHIYIIDDSFFFFLIYI